ncbi:MAG: hypothetical protein A3D75_01650 [Candidatus Levybacteria bacterium RIFCSPHIGHO2_02_FULL_37_18]|nr:MAG: hypothetical protein A2794_01835 [Alphaproteobacteria bacterium RIFCSPHIGHO2_01_FULL_40_8]OGH21691.1 MAG: hypothetical protein A3D75_01650 [Candidatus Levybacteria bacterium RIFCSPHIGHO2_02_FULL_37_18]OGH33255.1 MAG: hypothetical protein A3A47_02970 [Candidatus Levybacteria bacterium RIFCSPLOWO2_01_FULL_37_20]
MRNIIEEKPSDELRGRLLFTINFVEKSDIRDKNILDIGCGFGWFVFNAEKIGAKTITAVEITEKDLETVRKYINNERIKFQTASALFLPFEGGVFDTVASWEVIEHIPKNSEEQMFKEVYRVLKNGGLFYLSSPYDNFFSKIFDPAWWLIKHRHYTGKQMIFFGEKNGFKAEKIEVKGGWWEIIAMLNLYFAKWIFRRKPFFSQFIYKKLDAEFEKENGFTHLFIKFRKI